jgi:hypothetical protein
MESEKLVLTEDRCEVGGVEYQGALAGPLGTTPEIGSCEGCAAVPGEPLCMALGPCSDCSTHLIIWIRADTLPEAGEVSEVSP